MTGFGLLGHLREMCAASGVHARVVERGPAAAAAAWRAWRAPASSRAARSATARPPMRTPTSRSGVDPVLALLACDAQTSGGLLAAVPPDAVGTVGWVIGEIVAGPPGRITLV